MSAEALSLLIKKTEANDEKKSARELRLCKLRELADNMLFVFKTRRKFDKITAKLDSVIDTLVNL